MELGEVKVTTAIKYVAVFAVVATAAYYLGFSSAAAAGDIIITDGDGGE